MKYGNVKCEMDGYTFDSLKERDRYCVLKLEQYAHNIYDLIVHPHFQLHPKINKDYPEVEYIADFQYRLPNGDLVVEDVKSKETRKLPLYRLKRREMLDIYQIEVVEVMDVNAKPQAKKTITPEKRVTKCEECRYFNDQGYMFTGVCQYLDGVVREDDFCSHGKART